MGGNKVYILGISCYSCDSSAALLKDGIVVAAAHEERFSRIKHDNSFPINAIEYCLKSENITSKHVRYIGFYNKPIRKFERVISQHLEMFPLSLKTFISEMPSWINMEFRLLNTIRKRLRYMGNVLFVEHHLAHAASAFLVSPFNKATIVIADGVGEWTTTSYGLGDGSKIRLLKEIRFPSSLGLLYSAIAAHLGCSANPEEISELGTYGINNKEKNTYYEGLKRVIDIKEDGSFRLDMRYFKLYYSDGLPSKKLCKLLGGANRKPKDKITQRHNDIAAALQMIIEEAMTRILIHVHKVTKCDNLVLGGSIALNSIHNGKILSNTPFKRIWIPPDVGDGGTSIGVACYTYHVILGHKWNFKLKNAYLGPKFLTEEIRYFLDKNKIRYSKFKDETELIRKTAKLISQNHIVGWFQGRMEYAQKALGARSILFSPFNQDMKRVPKLKPKHNKKFWAFGAAVCEEDTLKYFDCDEPIPEATNFMAMAYQLKKEWRNKMLIFKNANNPISLQTIISNQNKLFYDLVKEFGRLSSTPLLLTTPFCIEEEPIVCTPYDAYKCMMNLGFDHLIIDKFLIKRTQQQNTI